MCKNLIIQGWNSIFQKGLEIMQSKLWQPSVTSWNGDKAFQAALFDILNVLKGDLTVIE